MNSPLTAPGVAIERPQSINPTQKKAIVTEVSTRLCETWLSQGSVRATADETVDFLEKVSGQVRKMLGWGE